MAKKQLIKPSVPAGKQFNKSYKIDMKEPTQPKVLDHSGIELEKPVWMSEEEWIKISEDQKEFGTHSSRKARHEEMNPHRDIAYAMATGDCAGLDRQELLALAAIFGIVVDSRLTEATIHRVVQSGLDIMNRESAMALRRAKLQRQEKMRGIVVTLMILGIACVAAYSLVKTFGG